MEPARRSEARRVLCEASLELARLRRVRGAYRETARRIVRARARIACAAALLGAAAVAEPAAAGDPLFTHGFVAGGGSVFFGPAFADIDGDGDFDAFGSYAGDTIFLENTGTATRPVFAPAQTNPFGLDASSPVFADLDADGDLDAVAGAAYLQNTGTATAPAFAAPVNNALGLVGTLVELADLDGDGDFDAIVFSGGLRFLENTGTASAPAFAAPGAANPFGLSGYTRALADIDGDGDLDAYGSSYVGVSFQRNTGSASAPAFAPPQSNTFGLAENVGSSRPLLYATLDFADVDGDGDLDAFASGYGPQVGTYLSVSFENTGSAAAPAFTHVGNRFGLGSFLGFPTTVGFGDIDADGDPDAFLNSGFSRNTGSASLPAFAPESIAALALFGNDPVLADLDGDGDTDALVGLGSGDLIFFENTAAPGAAPAFAVPATNAFGLANVGGFASPELADLDGDGDLDALVGSYAGDLLLFQNTGSAAAPAFAAALTNPAGLSNLVGYASPALADIDGDGDLDAFVGILTGSTFRFTNTGTATAPAFAAPQLVPTLGIFEFGSPLGGYASPALADIDGDGDLDAFLGRKPGGTAFFRNTGTASAAAFAPGSVGSFGLGNPPGTETYSTVALADFDGDGDFDAVTANLAGVVSTFHNVGNPSAARFVSPGDPSPFGFTQEEAELVDLDADGDLDILSGTLWYENSGSTSQPGFANPVVQPFGLPNGGVSAASSFADLDDDGDFDVLVGKSDGNLVLAWNTGSAGAPAFGAPTTNPFGLAGVGSQARPELADLDGDGDLDALVGAYDGSTRFFRNTGTAAAPAFSAPQTNPFGLVAASSAASPEVADLDADGDLDVLIADRIGRVVFFENVTIDPDACSDGLDNDGDGRSDLGLDPGCASAADTSELSSLQCDNGQDDDADGKTDWRGDGSGDPHCTGLLDDREAPNPPSGGGCGIGPELLLLGPLLAAERRRRRFRRRQPSP